MNSRNSGLPSNSIFAIKKDYRGRLLLGTFQRGLVVFDPVKNNSEIVRAGQNSPLGNANGLFLYTDREGDVFVGTESGLMIFRPSDDSIVSFRHDEGVPTSIAGNRVYGVAEAGDGSFFVATDQGLDRFYKTAGVFKRTNAALPGPEVRSIAKDRTGDLWIGTNRGLCRYHPANGQVKYYSRGDGALGTDYNRCAALTTRAGVIYLGGLNNGFNVIYPDRITENKVPPALAITDFKIANQSVKPAGNSPLKQAITVAREMTLSYLQSSFSFEAGRPGLLKSGKEPLRLSPGRFRSRLE